MDMKHILPKMKEGAPLTVLSVQLYQQWKHKNTRKNDTLLIVYKDDHDEKRVLSLVDPLMEIYYVNPEYRNDFMTPREYYPIDRTYSHLVKARAVLSDIYHEILVSKDSQAQLYADIYRDAYASGNRISAKEIYKWPYTLMSDMKVEDYYHVMLGYHYNTMRNHTVDKAYLDIEADVFGFTTTETNANLDPINACTVIFNFDAHRKEKRKPLVFTFLLRNHERYPQQAYFEEHLNEFIQLCHKTFDHQTVVKDDKKRVIDFEAKYWIKLYDNEGKMLSDIFRIINHYRPDTLSVWNIAYDIPKIAARMEMNGLNYVDEMCDPSFPQDCKFVEMNIDRRAAIDIADKKTYIRMASTTVFIDQMQSYAGIRKGRKAFGSSALDNIATIELGVGKLKFPKGIDVTNAAIKDYWTFVLYNITDVMRQVLIDIVTNDCMSMIYDMNQANCPIENLFKQTRYQKQIYYTNYLRRGFVPGNNPNVNYIRGETEERLEEIEEAKRARMAADQADLDFSDDEEEETLVAEEPAEEEEEFDENAEEAVESIANGLLSVFDDSPDRKLYLPGGLVGNPDYNSPNGTEMIPGVRSKHVFDDVMDMDYASEYPWAKYTRSLSKSTQIGRIVIPHKISDRQNVLPMGQKKRVEEIRAYLPGGEFIADYLSHDILEFGNVWFNLPNIDEMEQILHDELMKKEGETNGSKAVDQPAEANGKV